MVDKQEGRTGSLRARLARMRLACASLIDKIPHRWWVRAVRFEVNVGVFGLASGLGLALTLAFSPAVIAYFPWATMHTTLLMQSSIGCAASVIGTWVNYSVTTGRSPAADRAARSFATIAGSSQLLTIILSYAAQLASGPITASLSGAAHGAATGTASVLLVRAVQYWLGSVLAILRNFPQTNIFAGAMRAQEAPAQEAPAQEAPAQKQRFTRSMKIVVAVMMVVGIAGLVFGVVMFPLAILTHSRVLLATIESPWIFGGLIANIQGWSGFFQGWSGTWYNSWLRRGHWEMFNLKFMRSALPSMLVTAGISVALQYASDALTAETNHLAATGIAAFMSALIALFRGGIIAPLVLGLVGSKTGPGLRALWADISRLFSLLTGGRAGQN